MNPDQLRTAAQHLTLAVPLDDEEHDRVAAATGDPDWWAALTVARDATRTLAEVIEHCDDLVIDGGPNPGGSAYADGVLDNAQTIRRIIHDGAQP